MGNLGSYAEKYGKRALVLITESDYRRIKDTLYGSFAKSACEPLYVFSTRNAAMLR